MLDAKTLADRYGMYALPYATAFPDLTAKLGALYRERVADVPWLPDGWLSRVGVLNGSDGSILFPAPSPSAPWLDTPAKRAWWREFSAVTAAAGTAYAAGKADQGRALIAKADANLAFWTRAHEIATVLAMPVTIVQGAGSGLLSLSRAGALVPIALGLAGLFLWMKFRPRSLK